MPGARVGPLASSLAGYRLCIKYTTNRLIYTRRVTFALACPGGDLVKLISPALLIAGTRHLNFSQTRAGARVGPLASSLVRYRLCIKYTTNRVFYTRGVALALACPGGDLVKMIDPAILFVGTRHLNFP